MSAAIIQSTAFVALVYLLTGGVALKWLLPRMGRRPRQVALGMFSLLSLLIVLAQLNRIFLPWVDFFGLGSEEGLPAVVASVQLALVGALGLLAASQPKPQRLLSRLYLGGVGLVFLHLARDEYFQFHEVYHGWQVSITLMGLVMVAATLVDAALSPRRLRIWHACLLAGLAISASGGVLMDDVYNSYPVACRDWTFLNHEQCLMLPFLEESLEFLGMWLALVAMLGRLSDAGPAFGPVGRWMLGLFPFVWLVLHPPHGNFNSLKYLFLAERSEVVVQYGRDVQLNSYQVEALDESGRYRVELVASTDDWLNFAKLGYALHIVDQQTGESIASVNKGAERTGARYWERYRYIESITLQIPPDAPANRALWLTLALFRDLGDRYPPEPVYGTALSQLNDRQVVLGELAQRSPAAAAQTAAFAHFENGFSLVEFALPEQAAPGAAMELRFDWRSSAESDADYIQFLHLRHRETGHWWIYDQPPLGEGLPARLWYPGFADSAGWSVELPAELAPGVYEVSTGLYRSNDRERLPASDAAGDSFLDGRLPLGSVSLVAS